jgi:hypothetical protein
VVVGWAVDVDRVVVDSLVIDCVSVVDAVIVADWVGIVDVAVFVVERVVFVKGLVVVVERIDVVDDRVWDTDEVVGCVLVGVVIECVVRTDAVAGEDVKKDTVVVGVGVDFVNDIVSEEWCEVFDREAANVDIVSFVTMAAVVVDSIVFVVTA